MIDDFDDLSLSDLFFNREHPEYARRLPPWSDRAATREAILVDAKEFARRFPQLMNGHDANWLADNWLARV
jgi:hypothetical protein